MIGVIGKGSQFKRVKKFFIKKKIKFLLYKPNNKDYFDKDKFKKLLNCNIIFILSPNKSHFHYIKKFYKKRYIFCEKPPVSSKKEIKNLKKLSNNKIFFNYNFRFSKISEILSNPKKYKLGNFLYGNIITGHGLAFKDEYKYTWRSKKKLSPKGVFEVLSIHWIDLINFLFVIKKIDKPYLTKISKNGTAYDNSYTKITLKNDKIVNIYTSYSSPFIDEKIFLFTNGTVYQNEDKIEIRGPTFNLNAKNQFIKPKLVKKFLLKNEKDYHMSLEKSLNYFFKTIRNKDSFSKKEIETSLSSNQLLF